jgi:hypothetical protein
MRGQLRASRQRSSHDVRGWMQPPWQRCDKRGEEGRVEARESEELHLVVSPLDLHGA